MKNKILPLIFAVVASTEGLNKTKKTDILKIDPRGIFSPKFGEGFHFRQATNYGDMDELMASIKQNGVVTPLEVKRVKPSPDNNNCEFEVVFGFRRMEAVRRLLAAGEEIPYVTAMISTGNDEDRLFRLFASDTSQVHLSVVEQAEAVRILVDVKKYDVKEVQTRISKSLAYVYNLLTISKLPKNVKNQIAEGKISTNAVLQICREESNTEKVGNLIGEAIKNAQRNSTAGSVKKATAADARTVKPVTTKTPVMDKLKEALRALDKAKVKNQKVDTLEFILAKGEKATVEELVEFFKAKK